MRTHPSREGSSRGQDDADLGGSKFISELQAGIVVNKLVNLI